MSTNIKLEKFLKISKEVHGDKYDYSRVVIQNSLGIKVEIFCNQCQEYFWQLAKSHIQKHGHSKCCKNQIAQVLNNIKLEKFLKISKEVHGDKYDYSRVVIQNSLNVKVEIYCNQCQEYFWQVARDHLEHGHSTCGREKAKQTILRIRNTTNTTKVENFLKKAKECYGEGIYDYSRVVIKNSLNIKIEIYCNQCQEFFWQIAKSHLKYGHAKCGREKFKETCLKRYNVSNVFQFEEIKQKIKQTWLKNLGVDNPQKSKVVRDKTTETCLKRYNVSNPSESKEIQQKRKYTWLKIYNVDHPFKSKAIIQKRKETCLNKYGVIATTKLIEIQQKIKQTNLQRYGCEFVMQNPFIAEKQLQNSFKRKSFIFPSGKEVFVQGYEPFALKRLLEEEQIHETDILTDRSQVPPISWTDSNGKLHIYYVDIFIPAQNRCIEVKSTWTYNQPNVQEKQEATLRLGYKYEIWIFDEKGELIIK